MNFSEVKSNDSTKKVGIIFHDKFHYLDIPILKKGQA